MGDGLVGLSLKVEGKGRELWLEERERERWNGRGSLRGRQPQGRDKERSTARKYICFVPSSASLLSSSCCTIRGKDIYLAKEGSHRFSNRSSKTPSTCPLLPPQLPPPFPPSLHLGSLRFNMEAIQQAPPYVATRLSLRSSSAFLLFPSSPTQPSKSSWT